MADSSTGNKCPVVTRCRASGGSQQPASAVPEVLVRRRARPSNRTDLGSLKCACSLLFSVSAGNLLHRGRD